MKNTDIWFTSRNVYNSDFNESAWKKYIAWSRLSQLKELISLDGILNDLVFESNLDTDINEIIIDENFITQFFKRIDYVKGNSAYLDYFNLLAVIKEPNKFKKIQLERDFDFIGYDLVEKNGSISALVNCGGFDETFKPDEQNEFGLISDYERVKEIQRNLVGNNPDEEHADCDLFEVWRHKFLGRNSFGREFCSNLEYQLGETFRKSDNDEVNKKWCDGIESKMIGKKKVNDNRLIETVAWLGKDGQNQYKMNIVLGKYSLRKFSKGTPMIDCIPSSDSMHWVEIDETSKMIEIKLE